MKKYGSDPKGSDVHQLGSDDARKVAKSVEFHSDRPSDVEREDKNPDFQPPKESTPLYEDTDKDPPHSKGKADQSE